jgi:hypothetical protein
LQSEKVTVQAVTLNALTCEITLTAALRYSHMAAVETRGGSGRSIRMKTEVGLLSRTIVIQGGDASNTTIPGAQGGRVSGFATLQEQEFGCAISVESGMFSVPHMPATFRRSEGQVGVAA